MKLKTLFLYTMLLIGVGNVYSFDTSLSLDEYLTNLGVTKEQNAGHMKLSPQYDEKALYYVNLLKMNPSIKRIAEIGFCIGHSSDVYLSARPDIFMVSFDLMDHWFNDAGKQYIDLKHVGRHHLVRGDSRTMVPNFINKNQNEPFDLIIIDGGHEYQVALQDIINMQPLAGPETILIMDDTEFEPVNRAWKECIQKGLVEELERRTDCDYGWTRGRYLK